MATRKKKRTKAEARSRGLTPATLTSGNVPAAVDALRRQVDEDGGEVLATYKDPVGGRWQILAALPIDAVQPTPFQRDLSETHAARLANVIDQIDRFLDPIIAVKSPEVGYWTPNGNHRLAALRTIGAKAVVALLLPEAETAYRILALNTEKAHNVREKSLEVIRMARSLADLDPRAEKEFALEFEEPSLLTLGATYEKKGRFSGGAYAPMLKRVETFLASKLPAALAVRDERAAALLELDEAVVAAVAELKERGFVSPYLKAFVIARINPLRFQKGGDPKFDETVAKMLASAKKFDAAKIKADQVAAASGPPED
ncbi:MAG TPA: ParB N-terminal domain-containing protein [Candidatus Polarisedimenticolaceae bacterium]|nr:ParB N-terminal domain-containing protein [Candidatus Polarisedimenticolaceae bacterium]